MQNAIAFSDNDVATIAWSYGKQPVGCMGFAIYRIDNKNKETPLPSHAVFKGDTIKAGQTTADFPVQKFYWKIPTPGSWRKRPATANSTTRWSRWRERPTT